MSSVGLRIRENGDIDVRCTTRLVGPMSVLGFRVLLERIKSEVDRATMGQAEWPRLATTVEPIDGLATILVEGSFTPKPSGYDDEPVRLSAEMLRAAIDAYVTEPS